MPEAPNWEKVIRSWVGICILLAAFVLLYQPWNLGERELFRMEGFYAAQTLEMDRSLMLTTAHGVAIQNAFPLYPYLASLLYHATSLPVEMAMRLLSVLMTAATSLLIYITVRRARSATAAAAAAAAFFAVNIVFEKSLDAAPTSTIALGLLSAQLLWFFCGVHRANWNAAWIFSFTVLGLTFLAGGFAPIFYFIFPLIFMRRPLTLWTKLNRPGLAGGIAILGGMILLWGVPYLAFSQVMPLQYLQFGAWSLYHYGEQLLTFPVYAVVRFLPWSLLAWCPFCVALHPIDDTPIFSRYLRTIVIADFFLFWWLPGGEALDLFYLAGPLAILIGLSYEIAVRRYARPLRKVLRACGIFTLVLTALLLLFCFLPEEWMEKFVSISNSVEFRHATTYLALTLLAAAATLLISLALLSGNPRRPVWLILLLTAVAGAVFYWQTMHPYRVGDHSKSELGKELREALLRDAAKLDPQFIVYKSDILDLYGECRYLGTRVQKIEALSELPQSADTVYLLTTEFPQLPERNWTNLLAPDRVYLRHRLCLWKGVLRRDQVGSRNSEEVQP